MKLKGLNRALNELKQYRDSLPHRCETARDAIAALIRDNAQFGFDSAAVNGGHAASPTTVSVMPAESGATVVIAQGEQAMFIEFGAGVYYNGDGTPYEINRAEFRGYAMGSYGNHNGLKDLWFYKGVDGRWHATRGTVMQSPMYNAMISVLPEITDIMRSAFT